MLRVPTGSAYRTSWLLPGDAPAGPGGPASGWVDAAPGYDLCGLIWLRSLASAQHTYVQSASDGRRLTYAELRRATQSWANLLDDLGVPAGATVGVAVTDPLEFAKLFLGIIAAGRVVGPLDPRATDAELAGVCGRIAPHLVIADRAAPGGAAGEWMVLPSEVLGDAGEAPGPGDAADGTAAIDPLDPSAEPRPDSAGGLVLSTSGTTGLPKLIFLDERRLLHTAGAVVRHLELTVADRGFNPLPLFHINAEVVGLLATLVAGATVILDERFHRTGFWDKVARHRVTWLNAVPAILARLAPLERGETVPQGIRLARSASSPLPLVVRERFERDTGIPIVETYGMTEAASQITANPIHGPRKPGSVGRPAGTEVRVLAGGPTALSSTVTVGRVVIRGPSVIASYGGPGYEDRFDAEGWLETGDLGYLDEDGYLYLVGRADDVINRGGEKVFPRELEEVILAEPGVAAVAVVARDHAVLGSVPVAYLVSGGPVETEDSKGAVEAAVDGRVSGEELVGRVRDRCVRVLSRSKLPAAYHLVEQLPQGATGKVKRRFVAEGEPIYTLLAR